MNRRLPTISGNVDARVTGKYPPHSSISLNDNSITRLDEGDISPISNRPHRSMVFPQKRSKKRHMLEMGTLSELEEGGDQLDNLVMSHSFDSERMRGYKEQNKGMVYGGERGSALETGALRRSRLANASRHMLGTPHPEKQRLGMVQDIGGVDNTKIVGGAASWFDGRGRVGGRFSSTGVGLGGEGRRNDRMGYSAGVAAAMERRNRSNRQTIGTPHPDQARTLPRSLQGDTMFGNAAYDHSRKGLGGMEMKIDRRGYVDSDRNIGMSSGRRRGRGRRRDGGKNSSSGEVGLWGEEISPAPSNRGRMSKSYQDSMKMNHGISSISEDDREYTSSLGSLNENDNDFSDFGGIAPLGGHKRRNRKRLTNMGGGITTVGVLSSSPIARERGPSAGSSDSSGTAASMSSLSGSLHDGDDLSESRFGSISNSSSLRGESTSFGRRGEDYRFSSSGSGFGNSMNSRRGGFPGGGSGGGRRQSRARGGSGLGIIGE
eukprot:g4383.t1